MSTFLMFAILSGRLSGPEVVTVTEQEFIATRASPLRRRDRGTAAPLTHSLVVTILLRTRFLNPEILCLLS